MKDEMIRIRVSSEDKVRIIRAAEEKNMSVSEYVLDKALNTDAAGQEKVRKLIIKEIDYYGLTFIFSLEPVEGEIMCVGRIYFGSKEIQTGRILVFGTSSQDISRILNDNRCFEMINMWMRQIDSRGDNPFRRYMLVA